MPIVTIPFSTFANYKTSDYKYVKDPAGTLELKEAAFNLIAHYKLNENPLSFDAGGVKDSGTNESHPGTLYGNSNTVDDGVLAKYDTSYFFNYNYGDYTNRIEIPTLNSLINGGQFSFSCWANISDNNGVNVLASQSQSASDRSWGVYWYATSGKLILFVEDTDGTLYYPLQVSMSHTSMHHIVAVLDGINGNYTFYIDNVKYSVTGSIPLHSTTVPFTIGNYCDHYGDTTDRHWRGYIDDFKIFTGLLTDAEVNTLYNAPNPYALTLNPNVPFTTYAYAYNKYNFNTYGNITKILDFQIITGPENNGSFLFNIARRDPLTYFEWYYWNGSAWVISSNNNDYTQANTLTDIQANITSFPINNSNELYVKIWLVTDGSTFPQLDEINIDVSVTVTDKIGAKAKVILESTNNYGIKAGVLWYSNITNYGNKLNVAPQPSLRYLPSKFNVAPTEATRSIYSKFNVASTPELINYGSKYNIATYDGLRNNGNKFLVNIGASNEIGSKFNLIYNNETKNYGNEFAVTILAGSDYGMRYNLPPQQVEAWDNRGMKARVYASYAKYKGIGLSFFLYSKNTVSKGMKVTVSKIAETVRGIKFNISGLTNIGIKFTISKVWHYIDRLKTMVGDWTKI